MKILSILFVFISLECFSQHSIKNNPIYHSLLILNKRLNKKKAYKYSNLIAKYSKIYKLNPFLIASIARQESGITLGRVREFEDKEITLNEYGKFVRYVEVTDFCMMQINERNVKLLKLDPNKLLINADYCIHEGVKILHGFKHLKDRDPFWYSRYNALNAEARKEYEKLIMSHYNKIVSEIPNLGEIVQTYTKESEEKLNSATDRYQ